MGRLVRISALLAVLVVPASAAAADTPRAKTLYRDGPSGRFLLDGTWYKRADPNDQGIQLGFQKSDSLAGWMPTRVPNAANAGDFSTPSYLGFVEWYRKDFRSPGPSLANWIFRFESVNYRTQAWLNGHPLGFHVGAYLPFELRAKGLKDHGVNHLVVRVDGRRRSFDIPPLSVSESGKFEGGWWNYTGILREVYLRRVENLDAEDVFVEPKLRCGHCPTTIQIRARVRNVTRHGHKASISGTFGSAALRFGSHRVPGHSFAAFKAHLRVSHPQLWSPDHPHLYAVRLFVHDQNGGVVQRYLIHTGIRSWRVSRLGRIQLNGRDVNLRGASIHEDSPSRGAALTPAQMQQNFGYLRQLGATMTRAHYPLHPYELELADRYGIVVWSEIPVFRMDSKLFNKPVVRAKALRMLREEVTRDENHPAVAVWSIGNENASQPKRGFKNYLLRAAHQVRKMDPTRLIGIATSGYPTVEKQDIYLNLDVIGVNDYFGWYEGPRNSIADRSALPGYLSRLHSDYPNQAFVITEVGAEANRDGPITEKGTYAFQQDFLKYHLGVLDSEPFVNGVLVWNLRDFRVKPGWAGGNPVPDPPINHKGLVDDFGHRKPAFDTVRQIFQSMPLYGRHA